MKRLILIITLLVGVNSYAATYNFGFFGLNDFRDQEKVDSAQYGITAAVLWGNKDFMFGFGAYKGFQEINGVTGGFETFTMNFQFGNFYINPFYGARSVKASDLFKSNNLYSTQGAIVGYDLFVSKGVGLGLMGTYENPGELDSDETNSNYIKLKESVSGGISLKFWW